VDAEWALANTRGGGAVSSLTEKALVSLGKGPHPPLFYADCSIKGKW